MHARQLTKRDTGVAVVTTLFLLCTLSAVGLSGRERAKQAVCLANVKELGQAWLQYADDNDGKIVNGEAYASGDGTCPTPIYGGIHLREKWWTGDDCASNYMVGGKLAKGVQMQAIRAGALFPYCGTENLYHCPDGSPGGVRTYSIVDSMNGLPRTGTYKSNVGVKVGETVLWVKKKSEITVPGPALRLVFVDEGQPAPDSYATNYTSPRWWDPPPVRHGDGTNVCFADGHCEYWRWEAAETVATGAATNPIQQLHTHDPGGRERPAADADRRLGPAWVLRVRTVDQGESMDAKTRHLQKRDIAALILCAAFLISALGAVGESGRRRAKETVCQANLHQWKAVFQGYIEQNGGEFIVGRPGSARYWVLGLKEEDRDWKRLRIWLCPEAEVLERDEAGNPSPRPSIFTAWGAYFGYGPTTIAGSYGLNGYIIPIPDGATYEGAVPASFGWRKLDNVPNASNVPMFIDALRFDLWPKEVDPPASSEFASWTSSNNMARCCINRHDGAVCCLFVDGSVRKVGLKELWTLKWHQSFNVAGPWTRDGGVLPEDWPEWMRQFKDY